MVSLCNSPGCPDIHTVDKAGLELTEIRLCLPPMLGLKACATVPGPSQLLDSQIQTALSVLCLTLTSDSSHCIIINCTSYLVFETGSLVAPAGFELKV